MVDDQVVRIQSLVLCVRLGVLEEVEQELGRLLGPPSLRGAVDLGLRRSRNIVLVMGRLSPNQMALD